MGCVCAAAGSTAQSNSSRPGLGHKAVGRGRGRLDKWVTQLLSPQVHIGLSSTQIARQWYTLLPASKQSCPQQVTSCTRLVPTAQRNSSHKCSGSAFSGGVFTTHFSHACQCFVKYKQASERSEDVVTVVLHFYTEKPRHRDVTELVTAH